jgi:hypothetical protein
MQFRKTSIALIAGVVFPVAGICQSMGYLDADSPAEAAAMIYATKISSRVMQEACVGRFADLKEPIETDISAWQKKEAAVIARADGYFEQFSRRYPKEAQTYVETTEEMMKKAIELQAQMPGEAGAAVFRQACVNHFAALASGVWRQRTPNVYKYMDAAK